MAESLYDKLIHIEETDEALREGIVSLMENLSDLSGKTNQIPNLSNITLLNIPAIQRGFILGYEKNPILKDALDKTQSVEDALDELASVNKGYKKFLPRVRNTTHNERLTQLNEIVGFAPSLESNGILFPDNFVSTFVDTTALTFLVTSIYSKFVLPQLISNPESLQDTQALYRFALPMAISAIMGTTYGLMGTVRRMSSIPRKEARYVDSKIKELF